MVAVEVRDEDLAELAGSERALHELNLAPLSAVKHPAPQRLSSSNGGCDKIM